MAVPKSFLQDLKKGLKQHLEKKIEKMKTLIFGDSKGQSAVMMTFDLNSMESTC